MINKLLKLFQITTVFSVISFIIFSSFIVVEAKKVESLIVPMLWLYSSSSDSPGDFGEGYFIENVLASVDYNSKIKDLGTGLVITNGDTFFKGTKFEIINDLGEIFWFGTGGSLGTPYGEWYSGPLPLPPPASYNPSSCNTSLASGESAIIECFSVTPPIIENDFTGTAAGYSCDPSVTNITGGTNQVCTITSSGDVNISVKFKLTLGNLYSVYPVLNSGTPHIDIAVIRSYYPDLKYLSAEKDSGALPLKPPVTGPYYFPFPETNFNFNFTAKDLPLTNNPPTISITHNPPAPTFFTGDQVTFNFTGDDADTGDRLTYQIDWTDNPVHVANNILPTPSGDVAPRTTLSDQKSWATPGTKRIWARAYDKIAFSNWEYDEVTITDLPPPPPVPVITSAIPGCSVTNQPQVIINWGASSGATKYYVDRYGVEVGTTNGALVYNDIGLVGGTLYSYSVRAEGPNGMSNSSASVSATARANCAPQSQCTNGQTQSCPPACGAQGTQQCLANGTWSPACTPATVPNEICSDGIDNDCDGSVDSVDNDCSVASLCDNNVINPGEQCDKGSANGAINSGCSSTCQKTYICGNGKCEKTLKENFSNCPKDCPSSVIETMAPRVNFLAWVGNFFSFWFK